MSFTKVWIVAGVILCGAAHGFDVADIQRMPVAEHESTNAGTVATGRILKGLRGVAEGTQTSSLNIVWGRSLLQNNLLPCTWENEKCTLSDAAIARIVKESTSPMAMLFKDILGCQGHLAESECMEGGCIWEYERCLSSYRLKDGHQKKCAGDSEWLLRISELRRLCQANYATKSECNDQENCTWYLGRCRADGWKLLLGIPSLEEGHPEGMIVALEKRRSELGPLIGSEALSGINATSIFSWSAPPFQCPIGVDARLCHYAQASVDGAFRASYYCEKKYMAPGIACDNDLACRGQQTICGVSDAELARINGDAIKEIISRISDPGVEKAFLPSVQCLQNTQKQDCVGACAWDESDSLLKCSISDSWINQQFVEDTARSPTPICRAISAILKQGCPVLGDHECSTNPRCEWYPEEDVCFLEENFFMQMIVEEDPSLYELLPAWEKCHARRTSAECSL